VKIHRHNLSTLLVINDSNGLVGALSSLWSALFAMLITISETQTCVDNVRIRVAVNDVFLCQLFSKAVPPSVSHEVKRHFLINISAIQLQS
jgi:hypothetical protein